MRVYLTHCSKEKEPNLKGTDITVTPDKLYTSAGIQQFMKRCQEQNVIWGVLSDLYGVYLSNERHVWYEKHPDTVTLQKKGIIVQDFNIKLSSYDEIFFFITILRTFFEAEAETRIPPLVFASVMRLKPAFHRWRFKIVRTVVIRIESFHPFYERVLKETVLADKVKTFQNIEFIE